jgi:hypothetical protein
MATEWVITAVAERIELNERNEGETTFTVTNPGTTQDRVVFETVPGDGASAAWFPPPQEPQRLVAGGGSVSYLVKVAVPAGVAAGSYTFQGRAYSADTAPEEGSRLSNRVAFDVKPSVKPKPKPWWPYAVAAGVVLVVLVVVGILVFGGDGEPQVQQSTPPSPTPAPRPTPIRTGQLEVPQTWTVDFDSGSVGSGSTDIWFNAQTATIRNIVVAGNARTAFLGPGGSTDPQACAGRFGTAPIPFLDMVVGSVLCVQTTDGRIAVATVTSRVDPSPGRLVMSYALYAPPA